MRFKAFSFVTGLAVAAVFLGSSALGQSSKPPIQVISNVMLLDGTGEGVQSDMTIVIEGAKIADVFSSSLKSPPEGALVLDFNGRFVMSGLIDAHIHLGMFGDRTRSARYKELERMLYGGVVAAREMGGDVRITAEAARSTLLGEENGPDIYYSAVMAGPGFVKFAPRAGRIAAGLARGSAAWMQAIAEATDLRLAVARASGTGASGLKLYAQLDAGLVARIVEEAHTQGLRVWAHATIFPDRPIDYVRAGIDVPSHLCGIAWQDGDLNPAQFREFTERSRPRFDPRIVDAASPEMTDLLKEMARLGTLFEPTLANHARPGDDRAGCTLDLMVALARSAAQQGVSMVAGTDFVAAPDDPYPALQQEIEALVRHGVLTPREALLAATRNAAAALGISETHGTIETGKLANLLVLGGDPMKDISAVREVVAVFKRGRLYERSAYRPLEKVEP